MHYREEDIAEEEMGADMDDLLHKVHILFKDKTVRLLCVVQIKSFLLITV